MDSYSTRIVSYVTHVPYVVVVFRVRTFTVSPTVLRSDTVFSISLFLCATASSLQSVRRARIASMMKVCGDGPNGALRGGLARVSAVNARTVARACFSCEGCNAYHLAMLHSSSHCERDVPGCLSDRATKASAVPSQHAPTRSPKPHLLRVGSPHPGRVHEYDIQLMTLITEIPCLLWLDKLRSPRSVSLTQRKFEVS